jgi:proteic killer suppression protein
MEVEFATDDLARLETDPKFEMGLPPAVVTAYRKRVQGIRAALDERDFYALRSLHFEKLKGQREHQHSMRLNAQFRLVVEIMATGPKKRVRIIAVEDYH